MSKKTNKLRKRIQASLNSVGIDKQTIKSFEKTMNSKGSDEQIMANIQKILDQYQARLSSLNLNRETLIGIQQGLDILRSILQNTDQATILGTIRSLSQLNATNLGGLTNNKAISKLLKK